MGEEGVGSVGSKRVEEFEGRFWVNSSVASGMMFDLGAEKK